MTFSDLASEPIHDTKHVRGRIVKRVLLGVAVALVLLCAVYGGCGWLSSMNGFCKAVSNSPPWSLISGVAAAPGLLLLWEWRTVIKGRELNAGAQVAASARFVDSVRMLDETEKLNAQTGGLFALQQIALDAPAVYHPVVVQVLSRFVQRVAPPQSFEDEMQNYPVETRAASDIATEAVRILGRLGETASARVDLRGANLVLADLTGANLAGAQLDDVDLERATLKGAQLCRASLRNAYLRNTDLEDADLNGADLTDACLTGAKLKGAALFNTKLLHAKFDDDTDFPQPFDTKARGMVRKQ